LRATMHAALVALPPRKPDAPPFLPVDRVFALSGHGTIVTGTLMQGTLRVGETLRLQPSGKDVRIRSLHVFGEKKESVGGGSRVAANLPQADVVDIARGDVLASTEFPVGREFEVRFTPLEAALPLLRRRNQVRAYLGSAEILGSLVFAQTPRSVEPVNGSLVLRRAVATYPGEAFIVRRLSPKDLLGGGTIAAAEAERTPDESEASGDESAILAVVQGLGIAAGIPTTIAARANVREERTISILETLAERGAIRKVAKPLAYVDEAAAEETFGKAMERIAEAHRDSPWRMGLTSIGLAKTLGIEEALLVRILASYVEEGRLEYRNGYYAAPGFAPELTAAQRAFFDETIPLDPQNPLLPTPVENVTTALRASKLKGLQDAYETLLNTGALVKVHDVVYRGAQIDEVRARLEGTIRKEGPITMARFRDVVGTSRKFAVPLLEWFDASGITLRSGDLRTLRESARPKGESAPSFRG
jgi:selenocysteine-specific elongation factor